MGSSNYQIPKWVKTTARQLLSQYRHITWRSRPLPDFIVIGAQKAGTTSLFAYLGQHPQLLGSYAKEVHYFDGGLNPEIDSYEKGVKWYRANFPFRADGNSSSKVFEASPLYIFNPLAPKRIFDLLPQVKLIALLRNPTERAISHYFHEKQRGHETSPIMDALCDEEKRLAPVIQKEDYKNSIFINHTYKSRGLYREQLERYYNFFPRERILLLSSEEFFREPQKTLGQILDFVGIDAGFKFNDFRPRNVSKIKAQVGSEIYEYLNNYFKPHNQALYEILGKDYGW